MEGALEVARAVRQGEIQKPDDVVVATGTCATAAGLYLGFAMARLPVRLVAVRVVPMIVSGPGKMKGMANKALKLLRQLGYTEEPQWGDLLWVNDCAAPGYSMANEQAHTAMADVRQGGDFRTDVAYTGKTLGIFRTNVLQGGRRVLFWNTLSGVDPVPAQQQVSSSRQLR